MARRKTGADLSDDELRYLLVQRRKAERQARLEQFRRTGRILRVQPEPSPPSLSALRSASLDDEDEDEELEEALESPAPRSKHRPWLDRMLFVVEMLAVVGFLFVLFNGFSLLRSLNKEVSTALQQPTLTPTAIISAVVLPSGHTPPNAPGGSLPNEAEIPEHLRPLVQALASLPAPTPGPEQAVRMQIGAINVDAPVVMGDGWEQLKKGIAQHIGSPNPGLKGNIIVSAHNDVFVEIFKDLDKLKAGDVVTLFTSQRAYTYVVRSTQIVEPTQVEVMAPSQNAILTLISCYPYLVDNKRIVVTADLQEQP
jgi:sortase A